MAQDQEIQQLIARFQAQKPQGAVVQELEVLVRTAIFKPANALVNHLLQGAAYQPKPGQQRKGREPLTVQCIFGSFKLERDYYYHAGKQQGHYPADAALGLEGGNTPALARLACLEGTDEASYQKAENHLHETGGIDFSVRQIQRVVQRVGSDAQQWQERPAQPGKCDAPLMYVSPCAKRSWPVAGASSPTAARKRGWLTWQSSDIYLLDRSTGIRKCITGPTNNAISTYNLSYSSQFPVITPDGRFVAFCTTSRKLVPGIAPNAPFSPMNLMVYDTMFDRFYLGSPNGSTNAPWPEHVNSPALSPDGRYASFRNDSLTIYHSDIRAGTSEVVNVSIEGEPVSVTSTFAVTPDARYFVFAASASNMVAGLEKTNSVAQVYWRDARQKLTKLVSVAGDGGYAESNCFVRAISPDARYVAFRSQSRNLVQGMGGHGAHDLYVRDVISNQTWCVTVSTNGNTSTGNLALFRNEAFNANGSMLLFQTAQFANPGRPPYLLYVHDVTSRTNVLISTNAAQDFGLSADGRYALFVTQAPFGILTACDISTLRTIPIGALSRVPAPFSVRMTDDGRWTFFVSHRNETCGLTDTNMLADVFAAPTISPRIEGLNATSEQRLIEATAFPGDTVRLQRSSDLRTWNDAGSGNAADDGTILFRDDSSGGDQVFYRLLSP